MRREYDFKNGTRGKHAEKRLRIVGDRKHGDTDTAEKIQRLIERDIRSRDDFKAVWNDLNPAEREKIRSVWVRKINAVLAESP